MKLKNANAFYNFLHGRSSELSVATLLRVCDAFPGTTLDQLVGRKRPESEIPAPAITEATISITAPEPAPPDGTRLLETGPMVSVALEDLSRSLQALRMTVDLVERDLARVAAALDPSVRRSSPA